MTGKNPSWTFYISTTIAATALSPRQDELDHTGLLPDRITQDFLLEGWPVVRDSQPLQPCLQALHVLGKKNRPLPGNTDGFEHPVTIGEATIG